MFKCFIYTGGKKLLNATTSYNKCRSAIFKKQNSILASTLCAIVCEPSIGGTLEIPVCNTCNSSKPNSYVFVCTGCASKIKESQSTDTQQLKAEILAIRDYANKRRLKQEDESDILDVVLLKLSAV